MSTFQQSLAAWLTDPTKTQASLALAIGKTQVAVQRYAAGTRFPDADTARALDAHTGGAVSFSDWQNDFLNRAGLGEQAA